MVMIKQSRTDRILYDTFCNFPSRLNISKLFTVLIFGRKKIELHPLFFFSNYNDLSLVL